MRKIFLITLLFCYSFKVSAQQSDEVYRLYEKSQNQKTVSTVLGITGGTMSLIGLTLLVGSLDFSADANDDRLARQADTGETLAIIGAGLFATAVVLRISSAATYKKAENLRISSEKVFNPFKDNPHISVVKLTIGINRQKTTGQKLFY